MLIKANIWEDSDYHHIYLGMLHTTLLARSRELLGATFHLTNPLQNTVRSEARGFKADFANAFFEWIWAGSDDPRVLHQLNRNAKNFDPDQRYRNTSYGPRLVKQLFRTIAELRSNPDSRRGTIMILEPDDQELLWPKYAQGITTEYPCTIALVFLIRDEKLHLHVTMRSNNLVTTVCYDVYVFTNLLTRVQRMFFPELGLGSYVHHIVNGHVLEHEVPLAKQILEEIRDA